MGIKAKAIRTLYKAKYAKVACFFKINTQFLRAIIAYFSYICYTEYEVMDDDFKRVTQTKEFNTTRMR